MNAAAELRKKLPLEVTAADQEPEEADQGLVWAEQEPEEADPEQAEAPSGTKQERHPEQARQDQEAEEDRKP